MADKYEIGLRRVAADYGDHMTGNPLRDALPDFLEEGKFYSLISSQTEIPPEGSIRSVRDMRRGLLNIQSLFIPLAYSYKVYETLTRMIQATYNTRTSIENIRRINAFAAGGKDISSYGTQAQSGAMLGSPGIGKTTTIQRSLSLIPQVIEHERYKGNLFYTKQILWLDITCPADGSIKTFCFTIVRAIDEAIGSNHMDYVMRLRSTASSAIVTYIKVLCLTYNIGLICIDEIQNLVINAVRSNRMKPLIRLLTELTNDCATSVLFIGTEVAESAFIKEEYLRRRTRGLRLLPFKPDGAYRDFLIQIWPYQYTRMKADMTEKMAKVIYDLSAGIPAYIMKLFEEAQLYAIDNDKLRIDESMIRSVASQLSIQPPKLYKSGNWISDFKDKAESITDTSESIEVNTLKNSDMKRLYATQRGRRSSERDTYDLIEALKDDKVLMMLKAAGMIEEVV